MATLIEALTPKYSEQASVLTGNPNRVTVEVEDSIDEEFWGDILREQCPEKEFHFMTFQTLLKGKEYVEAKGKSRIMKMADSLNHFHIGCVDSDYDWILSDTTEYGKIIDSSPFLLQTYAYSIENLMCMPETLPSLVHNTCEEDTDFDFPTYFKKLSNILFELLVWSLYLYSKECQDFTPRDWHKVLFHDCSNLDEISKSVTESLEQIKATHPDEEKDVKAFENKIKAEKKIDVDISYLYVQGHALFNHIFRAILKPIVEPLFKQHIERLSSKNDKATYSKSTKQNSIEELLSHNYSYKKYSAQYVTICSDIAVIWKRNPEFSN